MGLFLRIVGGGLTIAVSVIFAAVFAANIGLYNPYPKAPQSAVDKPVFGRSADTPFTSLYRSAGEPAESYLKRLTKGVNAYMVHYWPTEDRYSVGVHPIHNYPMWAKSFVPGYEHFANKEFVNPRLAWQRGFGLCSQVSRVVYSILREQGIDARIVEHPNHVVVEARGMILDADYGVVISASAEELRGRSDLVAAAYARFPDASPLLQKIYREGWKQTATDAEFDAMLKFEAGAADQQWLPLLMLLWVSVAIGDAGRCWPKFRRDMASVKLALSKFHRHEVL